MFNQNMARSKKTDAARPVMTPGTRKSAMPQTQNTLLGCIASLGYRTKYSNIISFTQVECNVGNHFNPSSGVFKVPSDGTYTVVIAIRQNMNSIVKVEVKRTLATIMQQEVGQVYTTHKGAEASNTFVVCMYKGDTLWAVTDSFECECTYFSCLRQ
ncbi:uncharacterized protein LOC131946044 [Physella acuta]|uniref:uncharacterized protein LOC131946044 n=1 Tax=Physella acuta TaxID=109671 RepID=UPI0027DE15E3|nr:uncharacterized protein LOC131946044 [Physella acuta]